MRREAARRWQQRALYTQQAAKLLFDAGYHRDSVSRAYYAAYQAATAICVEHGDANQFPPGWYNPAHDQLPQLLSTNGDLSLHVRRVAARGLRKLRSAREDADYRPGRTVDEVTARDCLREVTTLFEYLGMQ